MRTRFQQKGDKEAIEQAHALLDEGPAFVGGDRERLSGYLEGTGKMTLAGARSLLTEASRMPGLDGQKMSKSYNNTITLRESAESVTKKVRPCRPTPPGCAAPTRRPPAKRPVWQLHHVYSDAGCRMGRAGLPQCRDRLSGVQQPVIDGILREQAPMRERAALYLEDPSLVKNIIAGRLREGP